MSAPIQCYTLLFRGG